MSMTWSRDGIRRAGHPQEVCYDTSGFTVTGPRHASLLAAGKKPDVIAYNGRYGDTVRCGVLESNRGKA